MYLLLAGAGTGADTSTQVFLAAAVHPWRVWWGFCGGGERAPTLRAGNDGSCRAGVELELEVGFELRKRSGDSCRVKPRRSPRLQGALWINCIGTGWGCWAWVGSRFILVLRRKVWNWCWINVTFGSSGLLCLDFHLGFGLESGWFHWGLGCEALGGTLKDNQLNILELARGQRYFSPLISTDSEGAICLSSHVQDMCPL